MSINLDDELGLITEQAYADLVQMKLGSVRNQRSRGQGPPFIRLNRNTIKYPLAGVKAFLDSRTVTPRGTPSLVNGRPRRGK